MKITVATAVLGILNVSLANAGFMDFQYPMKDNVDSTAVNVPGENPLNFCDDPSTYLVDIDSVDLDPNPPKPGENLTVSATGKALADVPDTSIVTLRLLLKTKYTKIPLISRDFGVCELLADQDGNDPCPIKKGDDVKLGKVIPIPGQVPSGSYIVEGDARMEDKSEILCLRGEVQF